MLIGATIELYCAMHHIDIHCVFWDRCKNTIIHTHKNLLHILYESSMYDNGNHNNKIALCISIGPSVQSDCSGMSSDGSSNDDDKLLN